MKTSKFLMVCLMSLMAGTCFAQTCGDALARVNSYRAAHKARLLKWDADMEALAKGKASDLASKRCGMSTPDQGQILFGCPRGGACSCVQAADTWYQGGAAKYKFLPKPWTVNEPQFMQVGTFMQVVWASASKLGCASASGPNGCGVVVCQFDEGVISMNEFVAENVLPRAPVTPSGPSTPSTPKTPSTPSTPKTPSTPNTPSTPKTPSGPAPAGCATSLTQINSFRNTHNAQGLVLDSKLTKSAQSAASKMADNNCALEAQAGQLVYNSAGPAPQGSQCQAAVKNWYAGNTQYVFSAKPWTANEPRFNKVGGFMNMVWASAKKVGCAESRNVKAKCSVVVCQFDAVVITDDSMVAKNVLQRADTTTVNVIDPPAVKSVDKHANCPAWATAGLCNFSIAVNGEAIPNLCPVSCRGGAVARRMAAEDQDQSVLTLGNSGATASA